MLSPGLLNLAPRNLTTRIIRLAENCWYPITHGPISSANQSFAFVLSFDSLKSVLSASPSCRHTDLIFSWIMSSFQSHTKSTFSSFPPDPVRTHCSTQEPRPSSLTSRGHWRHLFRVLDHCFCLFPTLLLLSLKCHTLPLSAILAMLRKAVHNWFSSFCPSIQPQQWLSFLTQYSLDFLLTTSSQCFSPLTGCSIFGHLLSVFLQVLLVLSVLWHFCLWQFKSLQIFNYSWLHIWTPRE